MIMLVLKEVEGGRGGILGGRENGYAQRREGVKGKEERMID